MKPFTWRDNPAPKATTQQHGPISVESAIGRRPGESGHYLVRHDWTGLIKGKRQSRGAWAGSDLGQDQRSKAELPRTGSHADQIRRHPGKHKRRNR